MQNVCVIWKEMSECHLYLALLFAVTVQINMCSVEEIRRNLYFLWTVLNPELYVVVSCNIVEPVTLEYSSSSGLYSLIPEVVI
jgi:hypothetical protein